MILKEKSFAHRLSKKATEKKLMHLVEMLYLRQKELKTRKKHFHLADEKYLKEAEKIISDELAFVIGIDKEEVSSYIIERINK